MTAKNDPCPANTIWFYSTQEESNPCRTFSNFWPAPFVIEGREWKTSEHYFQAMKFVGSKDDFEFVAACKSPMDAAAAGRDRSRPLRPDWEAVKDNIMFDAVYAKITQNEMLLSILMDTGDKIIVERTSNDRYWGDGGDGTGKNMLGITLMRVRDKIRAERGATAATKTE